MTDIPEPGTALPWAYRPQEYDDWGVVRTTVERGGGWTSIVVQARYDGDPSAQDLNEHREKGTDPAEKNARYIVTACNAFPKLVEALEHILSIMPESTGELSTGTLAGLLYNVETTARAALTLAQGPTA